MMHRLIIRATWLLHAAQSHTYHMCPNAPLLLLLLLPSSLAQRASSHPTQRLLCSYLRLLVPNWMSPSLPYPSSVMLEVNQYSHKRALHTT